MNFDSSKEFFAAFDQILQKPDSNGWSFVSCPVATWRHEHGVDKSPSFRWKNGPHQKSYGYCFGCGWKGDAMSLIMEFQSRKAAFDFKTAFAQVELESDDGHIALQKDEVEEKLDLTVFPEWWLNSFDKAVDHEKAMTYLIQRGVMPDMTEFLGLRFDTERTRVCFPVRDRDGVLRGLHGRSICGEDPKYLIYKFKKQSNRTVWYGEQWLNPDKPVVLAESVFDLASVRRVYDNVISPLTATLSPEQIKRLISFDCQEIITFFDNDKAGGVGRNKITAAVGATHVLRHCLPPEGKDAGEMDMASLVMVLKAAYPKIQLLKSYEALT